MNKENYYKYGMWGIMLALFLYMWRTSHLAPMMCDDFQFALFGGTADRIASLADVFSATKAFYLAWSGRFFTGFFCYLFPYLGKGVFNFVQAGVYVLFAALMLMFADYKIFSTRKNLFLLLIIISLSWLGLAMYRETIYWMIGSLVYLWAVVPLLAFMLPYRYIFEGVEVFKDTRLSFWGMLVLGLICGGTMENMTPAVILFVGVVWLFARKKRGLPKWFYAGWAALAVSSAASILAPGNFARLRIDRARLDGQLSDNKGFINILYNIMSAVKEQWLLFALLAAAVLAVVLVLRRVKAAELKNTLIMSGILTLTGAASWLVMAVAPTFPMRTCFFGSVLLIVSIAMLAGKVKMPRAVMVGVVVVLVGAAGYSKAVALVEYGKLHEQAAAREAEISAQVGRGERDVVVSRYVGVEENKQVWRWDLSEDPNWDENERVAAYYGVESIRVGE